MNSSPDKPCSKGHTSPRRKNGNCISCEQLRYQNDPVRKEYVKKKQAERRAKISADPVLLVEKQEYMRAYSKKNRTKLSEQSKHIYHRNNTKIRLQRKGINPTKEILDYIENHSGKCDLCNQDPNDRWKELAFDHCHKTNIFRGLLCGNCNKALGLFSDNPELMQRASEYVKHYQDSIP